LKIFPFHAISKIAGGQSITDGRALIGRKISAHFEPPAVTLAGMIKGRLQAFGGSI
jgi:hypothetical protein